MNPIQTKNTLELIAALYPRQEITKDMMDAWAIALLPVDAELARRAVIEHARTSEFMPSISDICSAQRLAELPRLGKPDLKVEAVRADAAAVAREREHHQQRITRCSTKIGTLAWLETLDAARQQLVDEYDHTHIPTQLVAKRACELIEWEAS